MKKLFFFILVTFLFDLQAQIVLEQTYDSASTFSFGSPAVKSQLMIIKFEVSGEKYIKIDRWGKKIDIYDMNHSWIKTISLDSLPLNTDGALADILYLSEKLFDTDSGIEFMYVYTGNPDNYTGIYNDDGSLIFSDTGAAVIHVNVPLQQYPIYNTSVGTKMILSYRGNDLSSRKAKVFSLPGTLSTAIAEANGQLMQAQGGQGQFSGLYPNPSNGAVTLQYELPKGEQYGEIVLYDIKGIEVKRYKVDNTFKDILLDNTMLPAGTYFYRLQTGKGAVGSKKMIIVK